MALRRASTRKRKTKIENVGFSSLPEQIHRKSIKKGFEFTLLVVGDSGLGKSTLVNSLFMTNLYDIEKQQDNIENRLKKTVEISTRTADLEERGVKLKLTAVDTPGFGDTLNGENSWKVIVDYIDEQFNAYYTHECGFGVDRKKAKDTRVHCCFYFIPPYVRGLRPIDIQTMLALQKRVNIIPIISKADSLTKSELLSLKDKIMNDIEKYDIHIYDFPLADSDDDEDFKRMDEEIKNSIPFAVIGSNTIIESAGMKIRGRVYPWGIIDIESKNCDFTKLRTFLCGSHMHDLKDLTHDVHYENYRTAFIQSQENISKQRGSLTVYNGNENALKGRRIAAEEADRLLKLKDIEIKKLQELFDEAKISMEKSRKTKQNSVESNGLNIDNEINQKPQKIESEIQLQSKPKDFYHVNLPKFSLPNNQLLNVNKNNTGNNGKKSNKSSLANEFLKNFKINSTPI